ncbi:MAG: hypothetical protein M5R41_11310 [Bacteroidia bacterium]|nr:hypothetical protein [Bacteroidia bacterium]
MMLRIHTFLLRTSRLAFAALFALHSGCSEPTPATPDPVPVDTTKVPISGDTLYLASRPTGVIADARLTEISGIAASRLRGDVLWAHNDSGDKARLYAIDSTGRLIAVVNVNGAMAIDWEDMASAKIDGIPRLYIADVGDNGATRQTVTVYRCTEPAVDPAAPESVYTVGAERMHLRYPDGARDSEALFVDPVGEILYLIAKSGEESCGVYRAPWKAGDTTIVLEAVGVLRIPSPFSPLRLVTAADLAADRSAVLLRTYAALYEYRGIGSPLQLLQSTPRAVHGAPVQPQAEAVCYDKDSRGIFLATEGNALPLQYMTRRPGR